MTSPYGRVFPTTFDYRRVVALAQHGARRGGPAAIFDRGTAVVKVFQVKSGK
jgi:hypothetical protein